MLRNNRLSTVLLNASRMDQKTFFVILSFPVVFRSKLCVLISGCPQVLSKQPQPEVTRLGALREFFCFTPGCICSPPN